MKHKPSGAFITSLVEVKLDQTTMFEWQRHSQHQEDLPHFSEILKFIDLRAKSSESTVNQSQKRSSQPMLSKTGAQARPVYVASIGTSCMICKMGKHPLYMCRKFQSLPCEQRMATVRVKQLCHNCLKSGHFKLQCPSNQ